MNDCLFCKIAAGEIPSTKVYENEYVYAFLDIEPQAPFHAVFIPKVHIKCADEISDDNAYLVAEIFKAIAIVAKENDLQNGYRVVNNCGENGGQTVPHLHFHLMGKRKFGWPAG
ncbi:MAG: histidine triad nucleotide-binding protein [Oscillospiraceae bacterium]|nr:histidine triad nucleotide-binding protein [Candidatus Equicaccousia limihippi]